MHGLPPTVRRFATLAEECEFLIGEIRAISEIEPLETVCLVARGSNQIVYDYIPALQKAGVPYLYLYADTPEYAGSGVRLATMHRVKGLEYVHVLIAGVNDGIMPLGHNHGNGEYDIVAEFEVREGCLMHVASSRARETVTVTSYGVPSRFLPTSGE